ncbi:MAG: ABC transporter permease [Nitrospinae bacterium]|nr:ABC transporter permease [Nitrospinota bacterium]
MAKKVRKQEEVVSETIAVQQRISFSQEVAKGKSLQALAWRQLLRKRTALLGMGIVALLVLTAALADVVAPYSPTAIFSQETMSHPSWTHPMGTDLLGRDVLSRVIHGTRVSIYVGVFSLVLAIVLGIPLGITAGFYGGMVDNLIMRIMDIILAFPIFLLAIVIMVILEPSVTNVVIALGIVRIPIYARIVRGSVLSVKELEYIEAAKALAVRDLRLLVRHVLPNCMAPIIVTSTLSVGTSIIVEASLSFLGLGTQPPTPSWGWDLKANLMLLELNPWITIFPGLAIFFTVLAFNLFGDGLRDALDPRLKQ